MESADSGIIRVLVHEYMTGGGQADVDLSPTLAVEGSAIRRAIIADFLGVPGIVVVATIDARLEPDFHPPGSVLHVVADRDRQALRAIGPAVDWVALIAPETSHILADLARDIKEAGCRTLGSDPKAIDLVGDKLALAAHLDALGLPTPPTLPFNPLGDSPTRWRGPTILKPADGAGSCETYVRWGLARLPGRIHFGEGYIAQPYLRGEPMSASFLVDRPGRAELLAVGRQEIEVDVEGKLSYLGGTVPAGPAECPAVVVAAVESVPGLMGFVGVDFLIEEAGSAVILEINPRPTTSYVGLARLAPPGLIAGAWLAAAAGPLAGTEWPGRLRAIRGAPPVSFAADGSIRSETPPP